MTRLEKQSIDSSELSFSEISEASTAEKGSGGLC